jgi:CMP/dCMP kinase
MTDRTKKGLIVTIDGPSGAGKSTVAKMLARALRYTYIDTGAMYRGVAYAYVKAGKPEDLSGFLKDLPLTFDFSDGTKVYLGKEDISGAIREPAISLLASGLSRKKEVREHLWRIQRRMGRDGGIVLEGRDTGSVVFPEARPKFYIDANPGERAKRRHLELSLKGEKPDLVTVENEMHERDRNDSERELAPLVMPQGAIRIDTTGIGPEQVVDIMMKHIQGHGG